MRVTAIVVTWDSAEVIEGCLAALDAQQGVDLEVIVVDNASVDGTVGLVERAMAATRHPVRLRRGSENRGFCGAVNDGLALSSAPAVLLVNPDARLAPDAVARMVAVLAAEPRCGSVQPRLLRPGGAVIDTTGHVLTRAAIVQNRDEGRPADASRGAGPVFGASGAAVLHRRAMLDDVAWRRADGSLEHLTEDLVAYFDDVELDLRARSRGWEAHHEPAALGHHRRGGAARERSRRVEALSWSNRLLVLSTLATSRASLAHLPWIVVTVLLSTVELGLRRPGALVDGIRRLGLLPRFVRRGREVRARARIVPAEVVRTWAVPLDWRAWIRTWWQRRRPLRG
jgi:N-acetylglucosaminyl-diphospho-decaprenol L-rhamnosyltransferase